MITDNNYCSDDHLSHNYM